MFSLMVCPSLKPRSSLGPWSGFSACLASSLCCFTHLQEGKKTETDGSTTCLLLCQANPAQILPDKSSPALRDWQQLFLTALFSSFFGCDLGPCLLLEQHATRRHGGSDSHPSVQPTRRVSTLQPHSERAELRPRPSSGCVLVT